MKFPPKSELPPKKAQTWKTEFDPTLISHYSSMNVLKFERLWIFSSNNNNEYTCFKNDCMLYYSVYLFASKTKFGPRKIEICEMRINFSIAINHINYSTTINIPPEMWAPKSKKFCTIFFFCPLYKKISKIEFGWIFLIWQKKIDWKIYCDIRNMLICYLFKMDLIPKKSRIVF